MKRFIEYLDNYIDGLLIVNNDVNGQLSYVKKYYRKLNKPLDLLTLEEKEFSDLINYLVFNDSLYIKNRVKSIKKFGIKDNDFVYLYNLFVEIEERLLYLCDILGEKDNNNTRLMERLHYLYSAFNNDVMADQIVDFNLVNSLLKEMNADEEYKKKVISDISENNVKILKKK